MRNDYRTYLRSIGRKPLRGTLRTNKRPGDRELPATGGVHIVTECVA